MNILFISYYPPEIQNAANERLHSFIFKLSENHQITLITSGPKDQTVVYPNYKNLQFEIKPLEKKNNSFRQLLKLIVGKVDSERDLYQFRENILTNIYEQKIDLIIGNNAPANILKLMYYINSKTGLPYISDLRDLDNFLLLKKNPSYSQKQKIYLFFKYYWIKKWLKSSKLIITTSEGIGDQLDKMELKHEIIYNGYNQYVETLANKHKQNPSQILTIGIYGTLYRFQNFTTFVKGYKNYIKSYGENIKLKFVGGREIIEEIKVILKEIPNELIDLTEWLDFELSVDELSKCDLFLYFGWKGYKGIYSAKIFTYLGLKKNIILCPGDEDVLEKLINETNSGIIVNKPYDLTKALHTFYIEKQLTGKIKFNGIFSEIKKYNRSIQAERFSHLIDNLMHRK